MSTPSSSTRPASGRRNPETTSKSVVFPAPLGPMMPTISPWSACNDTSCRALLPPKLSESPRTSSARPPGRWVSTPGLPGADAATAGVPSESEAFWR